MRQAESVTADVLDDMHWRGLIAHSTDPDALRAALGNGPMTVYWGVDPTGPSMHLGNLLQIVTLRRLQLAGHRIIGLVGGATGLIGDPKDSGERRLNPQEVVERWSEAIRAQLEAFWEFDGPAAARIVNNYDWTRDLPVLAFLRDIGKHFPVNRMLDREAVSARLQRGGISYTEFSYVLLQAMDYVELFRRFGCTLQTGGSDQWGNITAGVELIRRVEGARVHALATPLVTKADGTKFGKTESGTVWLDPELTSPYAFYQFLVNTDDRNVEAMLRFFTFRTPEEISELAAAMASAPAKRVAQRALAADLTALVHGADETRRVEQAAAALFGGGDLGALDEQTLDAALREAPHVTVQAGEELPALVDLLAATSLVPSKGAARRAVAEGGAYVNNVKVTDPDESPRPDDLLHGRWLVLRRGKRQVAGVELFRR